MLSEDVTSAAVTGRIPMEWFTCATSGAPAPLQLLPDRSRLIGAFSTYHMGCIAVRLVISWAATTAEETLVVVTSADLKCMGPADGL